MSDDIPPWRVMHGDCRAVMAMLPDACIDAIVTDPPYELGFMGKGWDKSGIAFDPEVWTQALRVLKPGGHMVAFGAPRVYHRVACAIEDAGFELRDCLQWLYGQGFPKNHNIKKAMKEEAPEEDGEEFSGDGTALKPGWEPIVLARKALDGTIAATILAHGTGALNIDDCRVQYTSAADRRDETRGIHASAQTYDGLSEKGGAFGGLPEGRVIAPAHAQGRWPANVVLSHSMECEFLGTKLVKGDSRKGGQGKRDGGFVDTGASSGSSEPNGALHGDAEVDVWDCAPDCPIRIMDQQSGDRPGMAGGGTHASGYEGGMFGGIDAPHLARGDSGGASRFFYCAKATRAEREAGCDHLPAKSGAAAVDRKEGSAGTKSPRAGAGRTAKRVRNFHPTVKPVNLMRWLVRLITPKNGVVLDPFTGSGTTGIACMLEGRKFLGMDLDEAYIAIASARIEHRIGLDDDGAPIARIKAPERGQLKMFG